MLKIGLANMQSLPPNNRIKDIYSKFDKLLRRNHIVKTIPPYEDSLSKGEYLHIIKEMVLELDVFFGYDRNFMIIRKSIDKKPPVLLPLFADMTKGGMTLWINKSNFYTNDILLFSSRSDYKIYEKICNGSNLRVNIVPLPLDVIFEEQGDACINRENNVLYLLYVGRLLKQKNIHGLIELCNMMKNEMNFKLLIVGDWYIYENGEEYTKEIMKLICDHNLNNHVEFMGHLDGDELKNVYCKSDIFINLTLNKDENFGLVQIEAMSQGLPIICSDWGGLKDHVINGWNGYKVTTQYTNGEVKIDIREAFEHMKKLNNKMLRRIMAKNARDYFEKKYALDIVQNQIESLIYDTITKKCEIAKLCFTKDAQNYCLQKIYNVIKNEQAPDESTYLSEYASLN